MFNRISIIVGVLVMIVAATIGYLAGRAGESQGGHDSVTAVSQSFITSLAQGDIDKTYEFISETFQARNGKNHIESIAKSIKTDKPTITEEEVFLGSGATANDAIYLSTVTNLPEKNNSTSGSFIIRLVNESGEWKVDSAQIY